MRALLHWIAARFLSAPRVIFDREGGTAYLSRWYLIGKRPADGDMKGQVFSDGSPVANRAHALPFNVFLHRFHRSDDDGALHSHPWSWAVSFILAGGYWEERREGDRVVRRLVKPWRFNFIRGTDYHRVDLIESDAWSLFLVGPKASTWYFWDRTTLMRSRWVDFIANKRGLQASAHWQRDSRD